MQFSVNCITFVKKYVEFSVNCMAFAKKAIEWCVKWYFLECTRVPWGMGIGAFGATGRIGISR